MTPQEKKDWVAQVAPILKQYLTEKINYPNCMIEQIMAEVPLMWALLCEKGMVKEGMTYEAFFFHARQNAEKAAFADHLRQMGIHVQGF